jgi:hypothetical protein
VAFFAKRNIAAFGELIWNYGTDFAREDPELPSFTCICGISMCRDVVSVVIDLVLLDLDILPTLAEEYSTWYCSIHKVLFSVLRSIQIEL